jgi:hypothetical protein
MLAAAAAAPLLTFSTARAGDLLAGLGGLARLIGSWRGEGDGEPGHSSIERAYQAVLGGKFLEVRNTSSYAPQKANPKGEIHHDLGYSASTRRAAALSSVSFTRKAS